MSVIAHYHKVGKKKLQRCYRRQEDGYKGWDQKAHCQKYMVFPDNITAHLAIDESSLSKGELHTFVSSRDKTGRKGKLIAMVSSTRSEDIVKTLKRIPLFIRLKVTEVSLDMASNMSKACEEAFPNAVLVKDRFHVVRLVTDALQHVRVDQRWKEIDKENDAIKQARQRGSRYKPVVLSNGDTPR